MKREHVWIDYETHAPRFWNLHEGGYAWPVCVRPGEESKTEFPGTIVVAPTVEWGHGLCRDNSPVPQITRTS